MHLEWSVGDGEFERLQMEIGMPRMVELIALKLAQWKGRTLFVKRVMCANLVGLFYPLMHQHRIGRALVLVCAEVLGSKIVKK
jgi:hypothetical protein